MEFLNSAGAVSTDADTALGQEQASPSRDDDPAEEAAEEEEDDEEEESDEPEDADKHADIETKSASSMGTLTGLPAMFRGKVAQCFLSRRKADEPSPLSKASKLDKYGGYVPWGNYTKIRNSAGTVIGESADRIHQLDQLECIQADRLCD